MSGPGSPSHPDPGRRPAGLVAPPPERTLMLSFTPGKLLAGLIAARRDPATTHLVVLSRTSSSPIAHHAAATREFLVQTDDLPARSVPIDECVTYDTDAGRARLIELLELPRQKVITTTGGPDGQVAVIELLTGLPASAWKSGPVAIIPCENTVDPRWSELAARTGSRLFRDVVVDRICIQPDQASPVVVAEHYGAWIVEDPDGSGIPGLVGATCVSDIAAARRLKRYLVNGLQTGVAALALDFHRAPDGRLTVDDTVKLDAYLSTEEGREAFDLLALDYLVACLRGAPDLAIDFGVADRFLQEAKGRIARVPDDARRILIGGSHPGGRIPIDRIRREKWVPRLHGPLAELAPHRSDSMLARARIRLQRYERHLVDTMG